FAVVNEVFIIGSPIGCLNRIRELFQNASFTRENIQRLEIASQKIAIHYHRISSRNFNPDVPEESFFSNIEIVRTDKNANVCFVRDATNGQLFRNKDIAKS